MMGHRGSPTVRGCAMEGEKTLMLFLGGSPAARGCSIVIKPSKGGCISDVTNFWDDILARYFLEPSAEIYIGTEIYSPPHKF